ncbi:MAG: septal ring lytic transglycosylase RlpA family protein [Bacteroidales bacterium]|nr:septal ring lytic transglycosylase RlpA family protein [Bacteroidales bacterium]
MHISKHLAILFTLLTLFVPRTLLAQNVSSTDTVSVHSMRGTFYSDRFVGRKTSSGEIFSQNKYTAAHHTYKFGTLLLVTNPKNGKQVIVRINDRCPKANVLDMTSKAAKQIGVQSHTVHVQVLPPRHYSVWENQHELLDILSQGRMLEYLKSSVSKPSKPTLPQDQFEDDEKTLYDLELFSAANRSVAKTKLVHLPFVYQDKVVFRDNAASGGVTILLQLSMTKNRIKKSKLVLQSMFPALKIIPSK